MDDDADHEVPDATLRLILDQVERRVDLQIQRNDALTLRAQQLVTVSGAVFAVVTSLAVRRPHDGWWLRVLLAIGVLLFIVQVLVAGAAWTIGDLRRDPAPGRLWQTYRTSAEGLVAQALVLNLIDSHAYNQAVVVRRARYLRMSAWLLAALLLSCGLISVMYVFGG